MRISRIKNLIRELPAPVDSAWLARTRLELLQSVRNTAVSGNVKNLRPTPYALRTAHNFLTLRLAGALVAVFVVLGSGGVTVMAAQGSIPGETLYQVKRATERVLLAVPVSSEKKARLQARLAEKRLLEADKLFDKKEKVAEDAALSALSEFDTSVKKVTNELPKARQAPPSRTITRLNKAFLRHQELLLRLQERDLKPEARAAVLRALGNLSAAASGTVRTPSGEMQKKDAEERRLRPSTP